MRCSRARWWRIRCKSWRKWKQEGDSKWRFRPTDTWIVRIWTGLKRRIHRLTQPGSTESSSTSKCSKRRNSRESYPVCCSFRRTKKAAIANPRKEQLIQLQVWLPSPPMAQKQTTTSGTCKAKEALSCDQVRKQAVLKAWWAFPTDHFSHSKVTVRVSSRQSI